MTNEQCMQGEKRRGEERRKCEVREKEVGS